MVKFLIVLPVRNGGHYLAQCVDSILAQTYASFRLVVLDNASDDDAVAKLRARDDPRITIRESVSSLPIERSWGRIADLEPSDEFLTIVGHDDLLDENFLATMSSLIERHPHATLYHAHFRLVSSGGTRIRSCEPIPAMERAHKFIEARLALRRDSFGTGYVCRLRDYLRVGGIPGYPLLMFADDALWISLMAGSYMATAPEECFSYRLHSGSTSHAPDWRPTLQALEGFLDFLAGVARADPACASAISRGIGHYGLFWFRWALFSASGRVGHRDEIKRRFEAIAIRIEGMIDASEVAGFRRATRAVWLGMFARLRWHAWQLARYLKQQIKLR